MKRTNTAKWMEKQQRWQINVQKDGVRKSFYSGTPGRTGQREANRKADLWLDEGVENQNAKVNQVYLEYLALVKETTSERNYTPKEQRWRCHIEPIIGCRSVASLSDKDLQDVINKAHTKGHLSKKTIMNIRGDLTGFVKYCRKQKLTSYVPEDLTIPAAAQHKEQTILQPEDLKILFADDTTTFNGQPGQEMYIYAYRLQVLTGLRPGELRGLKLNDYQKDKLFIRRSIDVKGKTTEGKNKNAKRIIYLSPLAQETINAQIKKFSPEEYIFPIESTACYEKHLYKYCEVHDLPHVTPYGLRHTFVSIAKTLPEGVVKSVVGHSANMDTFGVYGHSITGDGETTANALSGVFSSILESEK